MYTNQFAEYVAKNKLPKKFVKCALWIIDRVPDNGILKMDLADIVSQSGFSQNRVTDTIKAMKTNEPLPLIQEMRGDFVFDYPAKDVYYVKALLNALSNDPALLAVELNDPEDES
jgi:hypothetical protein